MENLTTKPAMLAAPAHPPAPSSRTASGTPNAPLTPPAGVQGRLALRFRRAGADPGAPTVVDIIDQAPPLRMIRAFPLPDSGALVHLHNISGGVLGGDQLHVSVDVAENARAQITTTGATRVYRQRGEGLAAIQHTAFNVACGGLLEYLPDPLIPYADAKYTQRTEFELADDAGLFAWDVVTPGREARNECFAYDRLELETRVTVAGAPIAWEKMALLPSSQTLSSSVRLGTYRTFATLLVCRAGQPVAVWRALEDELAQLATASTIPDEALWGVSTLVADGLVVRGLAREGRLLIETLPAFWRAAKQSLYDLPAIMPRKIY